MTLRVAVVGAGVMGANHARILSLIDGVQLTAIVDSDPKQASSLASRFSCPWSTDLSALDALDAAVIAVPTPAHPKVASAGLDMGLHLLVEKPLAATSTEAAKMVRTAEESGRVLAVGHVERFNPACLDLARFVRRPHFFSARRTSPYTSRIEEGVVTDLMIHDIDILLSLIPNAAPITVKSEVASVRSGTEDIAVATIVFDTGLIAQLHASRMAQHKVRELEFVEKETTVTADLLRQDITIRRQGTVEYVDEGGRRLRESTIIEIPYLETRGEPLHLELDDFVNAIRTRKSPRVSGSEGLRAIELCEKIRQGQWRTPSSDPERRGVDPPAQLRDRGVTG